MAVSNTIRRGFSVNVFLPAGDPEGIKVVEKSNWTGRGLVIPRPMFAESRARPELDRTGVYLLVGPSETSSLPALYVGEGDPVKPRLDQHARNKDFWTHAVVFTSKDSNLNKAHVQRLESRLVELASAAKRSALENGNMPAPPSLSEAEEAFAEGFLDDILLCLPILGYALFESAETAAAGTAPSDSGGVTLYLRAKGSKPQAPIRPPDSWCALARRRSATTKWPPRPMPTCGRCERNSFARRCLSRMATAFASFRTTSSLPRHWQPA